MNLTLVTFQDFSKSIQRFFLDHAYVLINILVGNVITEIENVLNLKIISIHYFGNIDSSA